MNDNTNQTAQHFAQDAQWEAHAKAFIAEHWPSPKTLEHPGTFQRASERWYRSLVEQGWSIAHWPKRLGGADWHKPRLYRWQMLCQQAQTPPINTLAMSLIAPLIMTEGASSPPWPHADRLLSEIASFEAHWCLGLLEPINVKSQQPTRVVAGAGGLVLTGAKRALADGLLASTDLPRSGLWPQRILCFAMDSQDQWQAWVLPTDRAGVYLAPVANQQGRWFEVSFDGVLLQPEDRLPISTDRLLSFFAGAPGQEGSVLPSASSQGLEKQLQLLKDQLQVYAHEDTDELLMQLREAEVALEALRALEVRALAPISPQFPEPLPMAVLNLKSQALEQQIGTLQLASFGYYALPQNDGLMDHNQGPINPATESAASVGQALSALAASHYGWNPRDVLAKHWLGLESES